MLNFEDYSINESNQSIDPIAQQYINGVMKYHLGIVESGYNDDVEDDTDFILAECANILSRYKHPGVSKGGFGGLDAPKFFSANRDLGKYETHVRRNIYDYYVGRFFTINPDGDSMVLKRGNSAWIDGEYPTLSAFKSELIEHLPEEYKISSFEDILDFMYLVIKTYLDVYAADTDKIGWMVNLLNHRRKEKSNRFYELIDKSLDYVRSSDYKKYQGRKNQAKEFDGVIKL